MNYERNVVEIIDAAEEVTDPLGGLVEKTADEAGAPFMPEALEQLRELERTNRAAFETLRSELKGVGCRVVQLDQAIATDGTDDADDADATEQTSTQADALVSLIAGAELFHSPDRTSYVNLEVGGHRETHAIKSKGFEQYLRQKNYEETESAVNSEAVRTAVATIEARAIFEGSKHEVHVRVAGHGGKLYLDLGDETWGAVEMDETGWRIDARPPVYFRRAAGMQPIPIPERGGSISILKDCLNISNDNTFALIVAWLLATLRDTGPYPVLVLSGEQGSAKSTFSAIIRALIDPNTAPLRALPRSNQELFISASMGHLLNFDNVSYLKHELSDTLCRLATGGGFAVRQLYTDHDEVLFDECRPIILNGIEEFVTRPDLADRTIFIHLDPIPEDKRRLEEELWAKFHAAQPKILGVLLDAVAFGLHKLPGTKLDMLPRLADFARWGLACEGALRDTPIFIKAYEANRDEAIERVVEADPVALAVRELIQTKSEWEGTATDLLIVLQGLVGYPVSQSKAWPKGASVLSNRLKRAAGFLRKLGIDIEFTREGSGGTRTIRIVNLASASSASSVEPADPPPNDGGNTSPVDAWSGRV